MDLEDLEYHQSVAENHPNLMSKFEYLKDLDDVDPFNISRLSEEKDSEKGKVGIDVTSVINYKTNFVVNRKPVTVYLTIGGWERHIFMAIPAYN